MATDLLGPIIETAVDRLVSAAKASGYFDAGADSAEPKSAPPAGLYFATWVENIDPRPERSGLAVTSCRVEMIARCYLGMLTDPQSTIDVRLGKAAAYMLAELTGDFGIDGAYIDLLGAHGDALGAQYGYVELDRSMFRIVDITVPFIADDVFNQEA